MALAVTNHGSDSEDWDDTDEVSVTFTPADNSLLVVFGGSSHDSEEVLEISDTESLTWTLQIDHEQDEGTYESDIRIWTAEVTTGVEMTVTVTYDTAVSLYSLAMVVLGFTGYDTADPVGTSFTDGGSFRSGSYTGTLDAAPASTSYVAAIASVENADAVDVGTGWTQAADLPQTFGETLVQYRTGSTSTDVLFDDLETINGWATAGIEIKAALVAYETEGFRFRNDDGSETTATWRQNQDTNDSEEINTPLRLRVLTAVTDDPASVTRTLQFRRKGDADTEWEDV